MNKEGISTVAAAVLIILISVSAVVVVWIGVLPMFEDIEIGSLEPSFNIISSEGYTLWDNESRLVSVQVERTNDDEEVVGFNLIFTMDGNSVMHFIEDIPEKGDKKTYYLNLSDYIGRLDSIKIAAVFRDGRVGQSSSRLDFNRIPSGDLGELADEGVIEVDEVNEGGSSGGGGGGGGGDSGGGSPACVEDWSCGNWGSCVGGYESRICSDLNSCGTVVNKPSESSSCFVGVLPRAGDGSAGLVNGIWIAPIGIPKPAFGLGESYRMYDDPANRNSGFVYTQNNEGGFYTHYVDNSGSCSDSENEFGSVGNPRCEIPLGLDEGSVVEIHGGKPYNYNACEGGKMCLRGTGTALQPVFIRGIDNAQIYDRKLRVFGAYMIIENLEFYVPGNDNIMLNEGEYIVFRNNEIRGDDTYTRAGAALTPGNYSVIYNNSIHNLGQWNYTEAEGDYNGVSLARNTHDVWIIDNHIYNMGGDGIGSGHSSKYTTLYYYIGRNLIHDNGENAMDFKEVRDFVISQNIMHSMYGFGTGSAGGILIPVHYGSAGSSSGFPAYNLWFIANEMYDATSTGLAITSGPDEIYVIGNLFYNISNNNNNAIAVRSRGTDNIYVVGNTMYNVDTGILDGYFDGTSNSRFITVENNIFGNLSGSGYQYYVDSDSERSLVRNNLHEQPLNASPSTCVNCIEGNPLFFNADNNDFRLQEGSFAIDSGVLSDIYQTFDDRFGQHYANDLGQSGITIRMGYAGKDRPQGSGWDIGAYEFI